MVIFLGITFFFLQFHAYFYFAALVIGFIAYFWMIYEERIHSSGLKHDYFEHTSSYLMIAQTCLALQLLSRAMGWHFLVIMFMVIAVIMYSISVSRIVLYKAVFPEQHKRRVA
jgi:hypothetical protein